LNAVFFPCRVGFAIGNWVSRCVSPVIERYGADVEADAVADADIPIHSGRGSVDAQLGRWLHRSPDFVAIVFTYDLAVLLKIRVDWHKILHLAFWDAGILGFLQRV
jgi:hypothetical protein